MAYWLKLGYFKDVDTSPDYWRGISWVSDSPGRNSPRWKQRRRPRLGDRHPPFGPRYAIGDRLVMYLTGVKKCPAILEVVEEPRWDPNTVDEANPNEGDSWGVVTPVAFVSATTINRAPSLEDIGVPSTSIQRKGHTRLEHRHYAEAERQIAGSPSSRERGGPRDEMRVPIEAEHAEHYNVASPKAVERAERRESRLVSDYAAFLQARGDTVCRNKILPGVGAGTIYSDLYNETRSQLVEAKADSDRPSIRMAIGQLADYARFIHPRPSLAVLLEAKPHPDLVELLATQQIRVAWREGDGFNENAEGGKS